MDRLNPSQLGPSPGRQARRLRDLAQALSTSSDDTVLMRRVAEAAQVLGRATGAYVERFTADDEAEVIASVGSGVPDPGARTPYPGAFSGAASDAPFSRAVDASVSPFVMHEEGDVHIATFLIDAESVPLGTLVLRKRGAAVGFTVPQLERVGVLAHIAGLALRRATLAERIERVIDEKFRLISGITHGLKEALGNATQYLDMLEMDSPLTDRQRAYVMSSRRSIDASVRLISELVELERAENGRLPLQFEPVNVAAVLRDIAHDYRLGAIGLTLEIDVPKDLPVVVTDSDAVRQILDNLLSNAVRYSPPDGRIAVHGVVRSGRRAGDPQSWLCLVVADEGPGVADPERIFEEVHRVERGAGTVGFRLAISRHVARLLGGDLKVESEPGDGAVFTLWLPNPHPSSGPGRPQPPVASTP
jgi:signal transduction histidine kinase